MSDRATVARPTTPGPVKSGEAGPSGGLGTLQSTRGLTFTQGREALSPPAPPAGGPNDNAGTVGGGSVVVRRGDTLWGLAERAYGEGRLWTKIRDANPTRVANGGQVILVGSTLQIPALADTEGRGPTGHRTSEAGTKASTSRIEPLATEPIERRPLEGESSARGRAPTGPAPLEALAGAAECLFPELKFELSSMPEIELPPLPAGFVVVRRLVRPTGSLTLHQAGTCGLFTLSQSAYEVAAKGVMGDFVSKASVSVSAGTRQATLSHEIAGPFGVSGVRVVPPNRVSYSFAPKPVESTLGPWVVSGKVGYEVTLEILPNPPRAVPIETPWYEEALDWVGEHSDYLVAAGFAVAGAAIITATLAEDAATFGAGTADDPLSFAAAAQMFGLAVQYAR